MPPIPDSASRLAPAAVVATALSPRRVHVRDPEGVSLLRGDGVLIGANMLACIPLAFRVRLGGGVEALVPPDWISEIPAERRGNVVAFAPRGAA